MSNSVRRYLLRVLAPQVVGFVAFLLGLGYLILRWIWSMWPPLHNSGVSWWRAFALALAFCTGLDAQVVLTLAGPGSGTPGKNVTFNMVATGTGAAGIQWTLFYPPGGYTATVTLGAAALSASKTLNCSTDNSTCVLSGLNANIIPAGVLATYVIHIPKKAPAGTIAIAIGGMVATDPAADSLWIYAGTSLYVK